MLVSYSHKMSVVIRFALVLHLFIPRLLIKYVTRKLPNHDVIIDERENRRGNFPPLCNVISVFNDG